MGGGCEFSMATDIRVASDDSRFGIPIARLGILVGYGEMRRLVNLVGPGNASYILLSGRLIDAKEAHRIGLITTLLSTDELHEHTYTLAHEMAELAPLSHKRNKRIRDITLRDPSGEGLTQEEQDLPFTNFDSADFHEGRAAFIERRKPELQRQMTSFSNLFLPPLDGGRLAHGGEISRVVKGSPGLPNNTD